MRYLSQIVIKMFKILHFSLTLSCLVSLALVLGGCTSTYAPVSEPGIVSPSQRSLATGAAAAKQEIVGSPAVAPATNSLPATTSVTAERRPINTKPGYIPETISSSIPSITLGPAPTPTMILESFGAPPSESKGKPDADTGYVLTAEKENLESGNSNPGTLVGGSGGVALNGSSARIPAQSEPVEGKPYTWQDGDRTLTVLLQPDLQVADGDIAAREEPTDTAVTRSSGGAIVKKGVGSEDSEVQPVFRSEAGHLMTLPGGVLLALDPGWSQEQTDVFFAGNGIELNRVSDLGFVTNGFFVETEPGFPSLTLANTLAGQDGVVLSSPNWWTEISLE